MKEEGNPIHKWVKEQKCDDPCNGPVKPNIVFFGEKMAENFHWGWERMNNIKFWSLEDNPPPLFEDGGCDLKIVIGTALAVFPFSSTPMQGGKDTPCVLINLENLEHNGFDFEDFFEHPERIFLQGKCDDVILKLCKDVGWTLKKAKKEEQKLSIPASTNA